ncbi:MAG: GNAT family N-acetyltransferase [Dehalococcoidia bacterium]|nr:GNAT family N-acetyltransferase [Dehalococcoidia bacterium]
MSEQEQRPKKVSVQIRQMDIDDISRVYRLGEKLFTSDEFPVLYRTWDAFEVTDHFVSDPDYCLVAETEADKKIVGFILGTTFEKKGTAWKKYGYLTWLGVDPALHRANLGHRLYKALERKFKADGARMVIADTDANNSEALAFFNAMGFSPDGQHVWLTKTLPRAPKTPPGLRLGPEKTVISP